MTKKEVTAYSQQTFESIKHIDENGAEFWYARELQIALEYAQWRRFQESVERAKTACEASGLNVMDHFADVGKMIDRVCYFWKNYFSRNLKPNVNVFSVPGVITMRPR